MILKTINQEVQDFKYRNIQVVPQLWYNQYETLLNVIFYYNSKFRTGSVDADGDKKYFFNIVKNPCFVYTKAIDFDTKNIKLLTTSSGDSLKTWFMQRDLSYWMRDKQFGKVLNRIFKELPIYGSVVLKIIKGTPYFVDLRNFVVEQSAETLDDSNYITEIHNYTAQEFRKIAKTMPWSQKDIDSVIEQFHQMQDTSHIRLYERYGEVPKVDSKGVTTYSYKRVFIADVGIDQYDQYGMLTDPHPGVELSSEDWEGHPYWEFHADKVAGRWLGVGAVESLFEPQIRENEIANLQSKGSYWAALRVFQTRDPAGGNRNLLTDVRNGEVLANDSEITQVDMSDRNLAFFAEEHHKWMDNRNELTFSYPIVQGQGVSGGRSATTSATAANMANQYFGLIQENVALDVKEMLYEVILPQFQKDNTAEHTLRLVGQDLDEYIEMCKNQLVLQEVIRQATTTNNFPTSQDMAAIGVAVSASIKQGKEKIMTIPKDFYKDVKYDVDIDITQESVDTQQRYATRFAILQAITADPTMTTDPVKKKILYGLAEDGGLNPADLFGVDPQQTLNPQIPGDQQGQVPQVPNSLVGGPPGSRAGGGVSRPVFGAAIPGKATKTL